MNRKAAGFALALLLTLGSTVAASAVTTGDVLDHDALLTEAGVGGRTWFEENVPFLEVPDANIRKIYYYRWDTLRRAIKNTTPGTGYVVNEFQVPVAWSSRYGGISLNPWHNNRDGRWAKNRQYLDDDTAYWLNGVGTAENQNYTGPMADSVWQRYLVTADRQFLLNQLPGLVTYFRKMESHRFAATDGLYWEVPLADGTEYTIASYQTKDPFAGGAGYRPTLNSYEYGDAVAIAKIARLVGDPNLAAEFDGKAHRIKATVQQKLWDPGRRFFVQRMRDNAAQEYGQHPNGGPRDASLPILPEGTLVDGRELTGYLPWMFDLPDDTAGYASAWSQLMDPQGFNTPFGPSTAERRHRLFNFEAAIHCCRWDGPQWPMGTSQTLVAMANLLHDYHQNAAVTKADFYTVLKKFTDVQFKNGKPYVAEGSDSLTGQWIYDGPDHSEHYNHSGYVDSVISGLLGIRPGDGTTLTVDPIIPPDWDYFALEDVPYHGHSLSVRWDRTGSRYGQGAGLAVSVDGVPLASAPGIQPLAVTVPAPAVVPYRPEVDLASNPFDSVADTPSHDYPKATASFTSAYDKPVRAIDGSIWYDPANYGPNSRWTTYGSTNTSDWLQVDFGRATALDRLKLYFYDDTGFGSTRPPVSYQAQYWTGSAWADLPAQRRTPVTPAANDRTTVDFTRITTDRIRITVTPRPGSAAGLTEVEAFDSAQPQQAPTQPVQLVDRGTGLCLTVAGASMANGAAVTQDVCTGAGNQKFGFTPTDSGYHRIVAQHSGKVVDIAGGGTADEAKAIQWDYLGGTNQQWRLLPLGYGAFTFVARHSSKALDVPGCRATAGLQVQQWTNLGNDCQSFVAR